MIARKFPLFLLGPAVCCFLLSLPAVQAAQVQLAWDAPTTNTGTPMPVAGYKVYYGPSSSQYSASLLVGNVTSYTVTGLTVGQVYYFAVTTLDTSGKESGYSNQVSYTPPQPTGPVAAYNFDEGSGSRVNDVSGNGNHGTISGATWSNSGRYGNALQFNGVNTWVTVPDSASLDLTSGMTLEAWVYPTSTLSGWRTLIIKEAVEGVVYYLCASTDTNDPAVGGLFSGKYEGLHGGQRLVTNTWTHVAGTYDGQTQRLFINGIQAAQRSQTGAVPPSNGPLRIGGNSIWGEFFTGRIDEVRIYNRALTAEEIQRDMTRSLSPASGMALATQSSLSGANLGTARAVQQTPAAAPSNVLRMLQTNSSTQGTSSISEMASELLTAGHLEVAEVQADHQWRRLAFKKSFTDPVVVAKALSYHEAEPVTVRIRDVNASGFEVRLESWQDADRVRTPEIVGYMAIERGRYRVADGPTIEAGTVEIDRLSSTISLGFSRPFQVTPVVMTAVSSILDTAALTGRPLRITRHRFQFDLQAPRPLPPDDNALVISYVAWEPSSGVLDGLAFEVKRAAGIGHGQFQTLPFVTAFGDAPVFLAEVQAAGGGNPITLRWLGKAADAIDLKIDDERPLSPLPDAHVVGYIAIK